jgi:hypothetical protein
VALSEREQKLLEQMEQALYAEDPRFATRIRSQQGGRANRRVLVGILGIVAGLGLVVFAVLGQSVWLGALGFALMVSAGVWGFSPAKPAGPAGVVGGSARGTRSKSPSSGTFMQRLEQRWERRSRDQW